MSDISKLVKNATKPPKAGNPWLVEDALIESIKIACKNKIPETENAFYYLSIDLLSPNGLIRMRTLKIIEYIFSNSKIFRHLVCQNLSLIARSACLLKTLPSLQIEKDRPKSYLKELEERVKGIIEVWDFVYGKEYPEIHIIRRYFKESLKLRMPNVLEKAKQLQNEHLRKILTQENILLTKKDIILNSEYNSFSRELQLLFTELKACFEILFPRLEGLDLELNIPIQRNESKYPSDSEEEFCDFDDIDWVDLSDLEVNATNNSQNQLDLGHEEDTEDSNLGVPYALEINISPNFEDIQNSDNKYIISMIREKYEYLMSKALPKLKNWKVLFEQVSDIYEKYQFNTSTTSMPQSRKRKLNDSNYYNQISKSKSEIDAKIHDLKDMITYIQTTIKDKCQGFLKMEEKKEEVKRRRKRIKKRNYFNLK